MRLYVEVLWEAKISMLDPLKYEIPKLWAKQPHYGLHSGPVESITAPLLRSPLRFSVKRCFSGQHLAMLRVIGSSTHCKRIALFLLRNPSQRKRQQA